MIGHFSVSGEWLTGYVRDLVAQGDWITAQSLLGDSIPDLTMRQIQGILRGTTKMVDADGGVSLEDDNAEAQVRARTAEIYSDKVRHRTDVTFVWRLRDQGEMSQIEREINELDPRSYDQHITEVRSWMLEGLGKEEAEVMARYGAPGDHVSVRLTRGEQQARHWAVFEQIPAQTPPPWWPELLARDFREWWERDQGPEQTELSFDQGWLTSSEPTSKSAGESTGESTCESAAEAGQVGENAGGDKEQHA